MGERSHVPFDVFAMRVEVPVSTAVRDGDLGWTCGQCPLTGHGDVYAPGDLLAQTGFVCDMIEKVMARAGFASSSVGKLHVYLAACSEREAGDARQLIAARFDHGPLIVLIPVPHFYYVGMLIEVDVFAAARVMARTPCEAGGIRLNLVEAGDQVWAHASVSPDAGTKMSDPVKLIAEALTRHGLHQDHLLGDLWMICGDGRDVREIAENAHHHQLLTNPDALVRLADPALPAVAAVLTFGKQPVSVVTNEGSGDKLRLTLKTSGSMTWVSGTCADTRLDLVAQTSAIMDGVDGCLRAAGLGFVDVVKLTAHYTGSASEEDLHANMKVRHGFYSSPGPASTGLPVRALGNGACRIAIEVVAVCDVLNETNLILQRQI